MAATYGLPREVAPEQAILEEIHRTAGHVAWLEDVIHRSSPNELVWGMTEAKRAFNLEDLGSIRESDDPEDRKMYEAIYKAGASAWLRLYQEERKHLAKLCIDAVRAGLEERRVRMAERQGNQLSAIVRAFCVEMGFSTEQLLAVPDALKRALDRVMRTATPIEGGIVEHEMPSGLDVR